MKRIALVFLLALGLNSAANAGNCSDIYVHGLDSSVIEQIRLECQKKKAEAAKIADGVVTADNLEATVQKWSSYGKFAKEIAEAIGILAKELGMAVNEFIKTDAGKLAVGMLIVKIMGPGFYDAGMGLLLMFVSLWVCSRIVSTVWHKEKETVTRKNLFGIEREYDTYTRVPFSDLSGESQTVFSITVVLGALFNAILICNVFW